MIQHQQHEPGGSEQLHLPTPDIIDLLSTTPSSLPFPQQVHTLRLSSEFEKKILRVNTAFNIHSTCQDRYLTENDEKELATEVLLHRHQFTTLVFNNSYFRQAAITIIQNSYLFRQHKIFFDSAGLSLEMERQEALRLFTLDCRKTSIPLGKTLQHPVLARIWHRIVRSADTTVLQSQAFADLSDVVERLNTLRNIYMLLTTNLVKRLTRNINKLYKQSVTIEDACQIGSFGIARAAYRYHPSLGVRFSTYASHWVQKEIQRQALGGRLIRISSNLVEQYSKARRDRDGEKEDFINSILEKATEKLVIAPELFQQKDSPLISANPADLTERKELKILLLKAVNTILSEKSKNILTRRYGLGMQAREEESTIEIARTYGVTRGSIYQLEQSALKKLKQYMATKMNAPGERNL